VNQQETIKTAPEEMAGWLKAVTKGITFKKWEAQKWDQSIGKQLVIKCDLSDVDAISKKMGIPKKTVASKKVVDVNLKTFLNQNLKGKVYNVRFRETSKKTGSKAPDAKTTEMQEKGSKYVFEYVLENKKSGYANVQAFKSDQKMVDGLKKIYPDVDDDWFGVFYKQHKVILDKFAGSQITKFDHSGKGSFMNKITEIINKNFGVAKKDNWNPADIWGVRGSSKDVIIKVEEAVYGSRDSQTIQQLNSLMRGMYKSKELVGISLKKTSGKEAKWEEYNIEALTLNEINDYKYNEINIIYNLKATAATQALDTAVQLRQSGGGAEYNFQITSNDTSKGSQNLKFESKPIGSSKARGGKAEIKAVEALLVDNSVGGFRNKHQNYPKNFDEFTKQTIDGKDLKSYKMMFNSIRTKVSSDCKDGDEFEEVIGKIFTGSKPWVAQSKLMQLTFLDHALKITDKRKYTEFWTDMLFLSIKKGDRFGPFGKLY